MNCLIQPRYWIAFLAVLVVLSSCNNKKDCPGFSLNLVPYIPQESRLVFYNAAGDSLVFNVDSYEMTEPRTLKRNVWSVGGSGAKPYCRSSCSMSSYLGYNDAPSLSYSVQVDDEMGICDISVNMSSSLPSNDYFYTSENFSPTMHVFGDTVRLGNYTPTTDPRFSHIEIIYGRGITRIQDDVEGCEWVR